MQNKIITRFAPSPTGLLHVGNIRTALVNWLFAKKFGGEFVLRIDDTDSARSTKEFEDAIKEDFAWLGMSWDKLVNQSSRMARYEEVKRELITDGKLYPCYESQEELEIKRKIQLSQGKPPIYDRQGLKLTQTEIARMEQEGRKPHFRFRLNDIPVAWEDLVRGKVEFDAGIASDPIIIREDGSWTYILCSVIDDIDMNISHIIRGDDHISNTAVQIQLFEALKGKMPTFAHLSRITSKDAEKISKRIGGFDIRSLREEKDLEPMTINNFLATIGTTNPPSEYTNIMDLVTDFDMKKFSKSPATYEEKDLIRINHRIVSQYSFETVKQKLSKLAVEVSEDFWLAVRHNLTTISEVKEWYQICKENLTPQIKEEDKQFLADSINSLPTSSTWNENTWDEWIAKIKTTTERKGKDIFMPIRMALTGVDHGPELKFLLPLIGKDKVIDRLNGKVA